MASGVQLCKMLIAVFPAKPMVLALITSATHLVAVSQISVAEHIEFLLGHLQQDPREAVQVCALTALYRMACRTPSSWTDAFLSQLCRFIEESPLPRLVHAGLRVLSGLCGSSVSDCAFRPRLLGLFLRRWFKRGRKKKGVLSICAYPWI